MEQNENKNIFGSIQPLLFPKTKEGKNLHSFQTITRQSSKSTIKKKKHSHQSRKAQNCSMQSAAPRVAPPTRL